MDTIQQGYTFDNATNSLVYACELELTDVNSLLEQLYKYVGPKVLTEWLLSRTPDKSSTTTTSRVGGG